MNLSIPLVNFRIVGGTGMGPMVGCLVVFQAERVVFIREHSTGSYSTLAYYLAKVMADLPFLTIVPVVQGTISYFMVLQRTTLFNPSVSNPSFCCYLRLDIKPRQINTSFSLLVALVSPLWHIPWVCP